MTQKSWYYAKEGEAVGPISREELIDLLKTGALTHDTLVFSPPMTDWQEASTIQKLMRAVLPPVPPLPAQTSRTLTGPPPLRAVQINPEPQKSVGFSPAPEQPWTQEPPFASLQESISVFVKVFLFCTIFFGLGMGLVYGDLAAGMVAGVLFGLIMAFISTGMQVKGAMAVRSGKTMPGEQTRGVHQIRIVQINLGIQDSFN